MLEFRAQLMYNQEYTTVEYKFNYWGYYINMWVWCLIYVVAATWRIYGGLKLCSRPKVLREIPVQDIDNFLKT